MASTSKYAKYNSAMDDIISIIRRSHLGKPVDENFLCDLKSLMENKMIVAGVMKSPEESILNTELESLPLPNEILVKIFGYLDIRDISRSAQVSHQFNLISKDTSLWKSWGKLRIEKVKVSTEFLTYITQRGIEELSLFECEILPPRVRLILPLNLKTLSLEQTVGDEKFVNELLTSQPMEKIDIGDFRMTDLEGGISQFIKSLPQIGSQLKCLNLYDGSLGNCGDLSSISLIVNTCLGMEELSLSYNSISEEAITYLCENLTSKILKLGIRDIISSNSWDGPNNGLNDNNIKALVKRCPKLKVLDIRGNDKVTYQGLVSISDRLQFIEYLGLPKSIETELGLPNNINVPKVWKFLDSAEEFILSKFMV